MRLFIGIELPADVKRDLASMADRCRRRIPPVAPHAVLRWVPQDNLHITVWFLGGVDERREVILKEALAAPFVRRRSPPGWGRSAPIRREAARG